MIMVFGASGFLGATIANHLSKTDSVYAILRPESDESRLDQNNSVTILRAHEDTWVNLIREFQPDTVVCAQWQGVSKSQRNIKEVQEDNISAIEKLARTASSAKCKTFITFGSQAESVETFERISENVQESGLTWYGKSKTILFRQLDKIFEESNTRFVWARVFTVYGAREKSDSLFSESLNAVLNNQNYTIRHPQKKWSFLYVSDFANAIEWIIREPAITGIINVGNPSLNELRDLAKYLSPTNITLDHETNSIQTGYFPLVAKLQSLGWTADISLERGCKLALQEISQNGTDSIF